MTRFVLPLLLVALAGCSKPGIVSFDGTVADTRGRCHTILGDDDKRYAVKAGQLGAIRAGQRVRIRGRRAATQDCAGADLIEPHSAVAL